MMLDCRKILFGDALWIAANHCGKEVNIVYSDRNIKAFSFFKRHILGYEEMHLMDEESLNVDQAVRYIEGEDGIIEYGDPGFPNGGEDWRTGTFKYLLKEPFMKPLMPQPYICFHPESVWSGKRAHEAYKRIKCIGDGVSLGTSRGCMNTPESWAILTESRDRDMIVDGTVAAHDDTDLITTANYLINSVGVVATLSSMYVFARILGVKIILTSYQFCPFGGDNLEKRSDSMLHGIKDLTPERIVQEARDFLGYNDLQIKEEI